MDKFQLILALLVMFMFFYYFSPYFHEDVNSVTASISNSLNILYSEAQADSLEAINSSPTVFLNSTVEVVGSLDRDVTGEDRIVSEGSSLEYRSCDPDYFASSAELKGVIRSEPVCDCYSSRDSFAFDNRSEGSMTVSECDRLEAKSFGRREFTCGENSVEDNYYLQCTEVVENFN